jgi:hypothetical protein
MPHSKQQTKGKISAFTTNTGLDCRIKSLANH